MTRVRVSVLAIMGAAWLLMPAVHAQAPNAAVVPVPRAEFWGDRAETWIGRFYDNVRQLRSGAAELLLIGDSITHRWETEGKATWDKYYGHRKAVNLGFGGDRTQHVLWRLVHGELDRSAPKVAVVMIGTNNNGADNTPAEIVAGVKAVCYTLRAILPDTKVLLLGIFPRGREPDNARRAVNITANAALAGLHDGEWIHYLDIGDQFLENGGLLPESIRPDALHPNARGYDIWAKAMEPTLARLMGDAAVR